MAGFLIFTEVYMDNITIYLNDNQLWDLAVILKRLNYNDIEEHTEGDGEWQKERTYYYLGVINQLQKYLADMGFNPR